MLNHAEVLLSTVQNLRGYLARHPQSRGDLNTIRYEWLPGELFPPGADVVRQAVSVLVNAGELVGIDVREMPPSVRDSLPGDLALNEHLPERMIYCAKDPLDQVAGY